MRRIGVAVAGLAIVVVAFVQSANAEVNVNVNVGVPAVPVPVPVAAPPRIVLSAPPEFILPSTLGFYVAVDIPYDMFYVSGTYYLFRDNAWYRARYYNGPWRHVEHRRLPPGLRKHKFERIRYYRDEEYRHYRDSRGDYRGRHFRPGKEWKEKRDSRHMDLKERRYERESHGRERGEERGHGRGHGGRDD